MQNDSYIFGTEENRLKLKGKFCYISDLCYYLPLFFYSYIMSYDKKCPRFVDPVRGWVKANV